PGSRQSNRWVTTRSASATTSRYSPTCSGPTSVMALRARSTAAAQFASSRGERPRRAVVCRVGGPASRSAGSSPASCTADPLDMPSFFHRVADCREPTGAVGEDGRMPLRETLAATATALAGAATVRRTRTAARSAARTTGRLRAAIAGGETGMIRMFDLHAASIAGDTLITVGLAGTIFFTAPLGEARSRVALYLAVTMVPFALLAPLIGPLLDRFRHGRRYALAATMLGRAMLAWMIAGELDSVALYPAVFGVLVLSRAYGVARAAAVPRLLPGRLGLSQVNARGSLYGTAAGAVVLPLGM